ncbi:MAG: glycosyltransferase family 2 protein [Bacteroidota bacterium]
MQTIFLIAIIIAFYTYIGYPVLVYLVAGLIRWMRSAEHQSKEVFTPSITLIVTAYNEETCIEEKIHNSLALNYPAGLLHFIFVTDGSTDDTPGIIAKYPQIKLLHAPARSGKTAAIQRAMQEVRTELVVFTDANTILNQDALLYIVPHYTQEKTGAVAGEKRIDISKVTDAVSGEGFYWRYESIVKRSESTIYSVVGAAGELFSIRTALYEPVPADTLVDDFMISMKIAAKGYRIKYEPRAFATETASASVSEERKRKVRIAAGGIQSMLRLPNLLLPLPQPLLWISYISHRILRWIITPYLLVLAFILNIVLAWQDGMVSFTGLLLIIQLLFYMSAFAGYLFRRREMRFRLFFAPYYFCLMNYGMIEGLVYYLFGKQTVIWEKAARR